MKAVRPGDVLVYQKEKSSLRPGPRARDVRPARQGDTYAYAVDKFWIVESVEEEHVLLRTPGGKQHRVRIDDPHLKRPSLRQRVWLHLSGRKRLQALRRASGEDS